TSRATPAHTQPLPRAAAACADHPRGARPTCFIPFASNVSPAARASTATAMISSTRARSDIDGPPPPRPGSGERPSPRGAAAGQVEGPRQGREGVEQAVDRGVVVVGVALHAEDSAVVRDGREEDRLDVVAPVEEELAGEEGLRL